MREKPAIPEERLRVCLQEHYAISAVALQFLPVGLDTQAGVYRVVSEQGNAYLLKATSRPLYEPGCLVPRYLRDQGISSIVAPFPASSGNLWVRLQRWIVTLYPFIDGDTNWTGMTDTQWKEVGSTFKRIHQATLPPGGFEFLRKEAFDPTEYAGWIRAFETQHAHSEGGSVSERALRSSWLEHQLTISAAVASLEKLAGALQRRSLPYVICHADLHPANLIRNRAGQVFVIDWDEVMLAPKERDFLFVKEPPADGSASFSTPPFFQGYGQTDIDWIALTYYRYERVIQDVIACAQDVFFRDDLGEEARADAVQLFQEIFAEGGEIDAAYAAAAHVPQEKPKQI